LAHSSWDTLYTHTQILGNNLTKRFKLGVPNYTEQKAWKALHSAMRVLKKGNRNTKRLAYTSLVRSVLECGSACWAECREGQINALDRVQNKGAHFTNHTKHSDWETLAQRRTIARLCVLFKAYFGERAWKATRDRLLRA